MCGARAVRKVDGKYNKEYFIVNAGGAKKTHQSSKALPVAYKEKYLDAHSRAAGRDFQVWEVDRPEAVAFTRHAKRTGLKLDNNSSRLCM